MEEKTINLVKKFLGLKEDISADYLENWENLMVIVEKIFNLIESKNYKSLKPKVDNIDFTIDFLSVDWIVWVKGRYGSENMPKYDGFISPDIPLIKKISDGVVSFLEWLYDGREC